MSLSVSSKALSGKGRKEMLHNQHKQHFCIIYLLFNEFFITKLFLTVQRAYSHYSFAPICDFVLYMCT